MTWKKTMRNEDGPMAFPHLQALRFCLELCHFSSFRSIDLSTLALNFMTPPIVTGVYNDGLNYDDFSLKPSN